ncbi:TPA: hypothetical protein ACM5N4_004545 [Escherichia coli]|uniref:hypothetical protein n=1 Tax=Escherichia coli TaxID=562 RepID=UPI000DA5CAC9|nr:hypothetical protein [Escherichia coli]SQK38051.1 Uncharacterised protein [Escherichia coli]SQT88198.1 Uncharacterised protein [Escherichia coli]HCO5399153.1 hypothetical protein [Escherichia coli]HCO7765762.1 hypothetical protein [Escherichia coli]
MKQIDQTREQRLEQLRKRFQEQTTAPRPETLKRLLAVTPDTLNNIVESQVGTLAESYTDSEPIALGVQLFVRISRQFSHLPPFVVVDVVCLLGNLFGCRDQFVEVLSDMQLI